MVLRLFKSRFGLVDDISYDYADGKFVPKRAGSDTDRLTQLLSENPEVNGRVFEDLASELGVSRNEARNFLKDGVESGKIDRTVGLKNAHIYRLRSRGDQAQNCAT